MERAENGMGGHGEGPELAIYMAPEGNAREDLEELHSGAQERADRDRVSTRAVDDVQEDLEEAAVDKTRRI